METAGYELVDQGTYPAALALLVEHGLHPFGGKLIAVAGLVDAEGNPLWPRHDCRHFHASFLIMSGSSDVQVAERLGRADTTVSRKVYLHLFNELSGHANRLGADLEHLILAARPSIQRPAQ
ncbi:MAG: hypothetical protein ACR2FJ_03770 [Qipengyuania sp.]